MNELIVSDIIELIGKNLLGEDNLDVIQKEVDKLRGICLKREGGRYDKIKYIYEFYQEPRMIILYLCTAVTFHPSSGAEHRFRIDTKGMNRINLYDFEKSVISEEEFTKAYNDCLNELTKRNPR